MEIQILTSWKAEKCATSMLGFEGKWSQHFHVKGLKCLSFWMILHDFTWFCIILYLSIIYLSIPIYTYLYLSIPCVCPNFKRNIIIIKLTTIFHAGCVPSTFEVGPCTSKSLVQMTVLGRHGMLITQHRWIAYCWFLKMLNSEFREGQVFRVFFIGKSCLVQFERFNGRSYCILVCLDLLAVPSGFLSQNS